jgi:hypothetical protein
MPVSLFVDLPISNSSSPVAVIRGPYPAETAVVGSPFTLVGQSFAQGSFTVDIGTLTPAVYRVDVSLSGAQVASGLIDIKADSTYVRLYDVIPPQIEAEELANALDDTIANQVVNILLGRFSVSQGVSGVAQVATQVVTRAERESLGDYYVANFRQYLKSNSEMIIGIHPSAKNGTGRLVWTAKPDINADPISLQVSSSDGLVTPSGGSFVSGDASLVGIVVGSDPIRSVRLSLKARAVSTLPAGRLYWDLRRYDTTPAAVWPLATGVIDFLQPVNQATS